MPKVEPEELTIEAVEQALDLPISKWHGQCYGIATGILEAGLVEGDAIYGHYHGPISKDGFWAGRAGHAFVQHGWILLPDERVLDPTRFSFENKDPYIYIEDNAEDYDEGGDRWRAAMVRPCPDPGEGDTLKGRQGWKFGDEEGLTFHLLTGTPLDNITVAQAFWVANLPYASIEKSIPHIYPVFARNKMKAAIPLDNWNRAFREGLITEAY